MSSLPVVRAVTVVVALYIETTGSIQARVGMTWVNINLQEQQRPTEVFDWLM